MMRVMRLTVCLLAAVMPTGGMHANASAAASASEQADVAQTLIDLSKRKWLWMADRNMVELERLFHPSARFVHMGATMDRAAELDVIETGRIEYRKADIGDTSVEIISDTAIVYSRLRLLAVVGGNEVTNPFSVSEVYVHSDGRWQLAAMSFTRLLGD